jgi:hypothetical protein
MEFTDDEYKDWKLPEDLCENADPESDKDELT